MEKGTLGYINAYKKRYGMLMLILAICIIAGTAAVYLIFGTVKHVAILIPIILALPFAKMLTLWIIAAKFHSMIPEDGELIGNGLSGRKNCIVLYDMALSSYEAVSFASAVVIDQGNIYLLWGGSNEQKYGEEKQREYVQGIVNKTGYTYQVYTAHDVRELLDMVTANPVSEEDLEVKCNRLKTRMLDVCL